MVWQHFPRLLSTTKANRLLLIDLTNAFMLLTRLPVARFGRVDEPPDLSRCVWAFPVVGLVVNGIGGLAYWLAHRCGMSSSLAASWTLVATMATTGALHEDGLADTADGFGGGATPARKMEIMRDSRIGSYGVLALLLSVVIRVTALAALGQPAVVLITLIAAGFLGRCGILLLLKVFEPARADGLGAAVGRPSARSVAVGLSLTVVGSFVFLPLVPAVAVLVLGLGTTLIFGVVSKRQIGGYTGDVLGASEVITECVVLTAAACVFGN